MTELHIAHIEGVAVRADRRRQGHGARLMAPLERIVRAGLAAGDLAGLGRPVGAGQLLGTQLGVHLPRRARQHVAGL